MIYSRCNNITKLHINEIEVKLLNNRIKELRNHLGLSGDQFGKAIGVSRAAISKIEVGTNNVSDRTISTIVREFGVNEEWLRTGKGEMFIQRDNVEELVSLVSKVVKTDNRFVINTLKEMCKLSPDCWDEIEKMVKKIAKE